MILFLDHQILPISRLSWWISSLFHLSSVHRLSPSLHLIGHRSLVLQLYRRGRFELGRRLKKENDVDWRWSSIPTRRCDDGRYIVMVPNLSSRASLKLAAVAVTSIVERVDWTKSGRMTNLGSPTALVTTDFLTKPLIFSRLGHWSTRLASRFLAAAWSNTHTPNSDVK